MSLVYNKKLSHSAGHRKRACDKLIKAGYENLFDYEIVELMLFLIFKRKDVKPLAKTLINKFRTIDGVLNATMEQLLEVEGVGENAFRAIKIINGIVKASLKSRIMKRDSIECFEDVISYCKVNMKHLVIEELRVIFLNAVNEVIADDVLQEGDIDSVEICPRSIMKKCLENGAKGVILVHNHPSGDPTPSVNDVYTTMKIKEAANTLGIVIVDHIIIGGERYVSLKTLNLLGK
ncbi:MAG: DNA repair protein RadC [Holosporales bacterium]|jgi:DNA repair protein RadC|nr:DNA repair protein RadC [Holosporales bacterium]